jgi:methionine-rich copper-binding protein CopC
MRWITSLFLALFLAVVPAGAAMGHASLVSSDPADGAVLEVAPESVVLTFNEKLLSDLVEVSVLDANRELVMVTEAAQSPPPQTDVVVPWPTRLPIGEYSLAYRVVSADGHPITGLITFSYETVPAPVGEPVEAPLPMEEVVTTETPEWIQEAIDSDNSIIGTLLVVTAVVVVAGVVISIVMLARSRK